MLEAVSNNLAKHIGYQLDASHDQIEIYAYGLQILLGAVIKAVLIIFIAWLLHILKITLVLFLFFALFRWYGGGAHLNTWLRCLIVGTSIIIGLGTLSNLPYNLQFQKLLFGITLLMAIYSCIKWVPAGTEKKRITNEKKRNLQKKKFLVIIGLWVAVLLYLNIFNLYIYVMPVILGCLGGLFLIAPIGYKFFAAIDSLAEKWKGGEDYV